MVESTTQENSGGDWVWSALLISLVVIGLIGFLAVVYIGSQAGSVPDFLVESGPFLLVLVTLINIGLSGLAFLESRKERRLTRDTLNESRKTGVIETIVRSIEPISERLENDRKMLSQSDNGYDTYKKVSNIGIPTSDIMDDISHHYPNIVSDINQYTEDKNRYNKNWEELEETISTAIANGQIPNETKSQLIQLSQYVTELKVEENSDDFAQIALTMEKPQSCRGWISNNIDAVKRILIDLRSINRFEDDFEELDELRQTLISHNMAIQTRINESRSELQNQYDIRNSEIANRLDEQQNDVNSWK